MARKVGLTQASVLAAAGEVADAAGFDHVTLAAVAARVGVRSPSLYAHYDGIEALRRALCLQAASMLATALQEARRGRRGGRALEGVCLAYLTFARRHPGGYAAIHAVAPNDSDTELYLALAEVVVPLVGCLAEMGVAPAEMIHQTRVVRSGLHGFASLERGNGFGRPVDFDLSFEHLVRLLTSAIPAAG
ncbi:MAG: WHG domain-containing protein [Gemmatimonadota bacterium]|nr:WHG domain-containing protein [Gemmatimonadota bacterium]